MRKLAVLLIVSLLLLSGCSVCELKHSESSVEPEEKPYIEDPYGVRLTDGQIIDENTNFPLVAALPEDNIYLYNILPQGVVLYQDGAGRYFDWMGMSRPQMIMPRLKYADFDGDGIKEIAEIECIGTGTSFNVSELHVLKFDEKTPDYYERVQRYKEYTVTIDDLLGEKDFVYKDGTALFKGITIGFAERNEEGGDITGVSFGNIVYFSFSDSGGIVCKAAIGYRYENWATPDFFIDMVMNISFDGEGFNIDNYHFNNDNYEHY